MKHWALINLGRLLKKIMDENFLLIFSISVYLRRGDKRRLDSFGTGTLVNGEHALFAATISIGRALPPPHPLKKDGWISLVIDRVSLQWTTTVGEREPLWRMSTVSHALKNGHVTRESDLKLTRRLISSTCVPGCSRMCSRALRCSLSI